MWSLVVHSDEDVRDLAGDAVRAAFEAVRVAPKLIKDGNLADAKQSLDDWKIDECGLVILEATAPATRKASVAGSTREPVVAFIKSIKAQRSSLPVIVLAPDADEALSLVLGVFPATAHVELVPDWRDLLQRRATDLLRDVPPPDRARLELDITLAGAQRSAWAMLRTGDNPFREFGTLSVEEKELDRLIRRSKALGTYVRDDGWQDELSDISIDLTRLLFENASMNRTLWRKFVDHRAKVGGVENTRVRVTLNDQTHPVLIEALKDDDDPAYWMLRAPIFRRYECAMAHPPLFKDPASREGPINFLVIEADPAPGNVPDGEWSGEFAPLPGLATEAGDLVAIFEKARNASGGGVVDRLSLAEVEGDPIDAVLRKLRERHWHIVHFAGHGTVSAGGKAGLVLVPYRDGVLPVADLANKLVGTQFLFLNCCRSGDSYFVMRAVESLVPAVLGFRWTVPDASGANFARAFYEALFERGEPSYKYLEYAFMRARRAIHDRNSSDPTWASPMLVMQLA